MRSIVCRFKDEADFLHHLRTGYSSRGPALVLVARLELDAGETLEFHGFVSKLREEIRVSATVFEKTPVALDDGGCETAFRYVLVVEPGDAVWLEMFGQKLTMMQGIAIAA